MASRIGSRPTTTTATVSSAYDEQNLHGTSVELADTDVDGLNDGDEVFYYGTSPIYAATPTVTASAMGTNSPWATIP